MIYLAFIISGLTYIPIIFFPCTATNVIQSLGVGVGASMIGTYQLMFNEQYGKQKHFLTISILSIPPLLADFIASTVQSTFTSMQKNTTAQTYKYLWLIGLIITIVAFGLSFLIKENRTVLYCDNKYKETLQTKNE
jgi:hypothetical protein